MIGHLLDIVLLIPQVFFVFALICLLSSLIQYMEVNVAKHVRILHKHNGGWIMAILRLLMFSFIGYGLFGMYLDLDDRLFKFGYIFSAVIFGTATMIAFLITIKKHPYT